jgi:hypothetical protein
MKIHSQKFQIKKKVWKISYTLALIVYVTQFGKCHPECVLTLILIKLDSGYEVDLFKEKQSFTKKKPLPSTWSQMRNNAPARH